MDKNIMNSIENTLPKSSDFTIVNKMEDFLSTIQEYNNAIAKTDDKEDLIQEKNDFIDASIADINYDMSINSYDDVTRSKIELLNISVDDMKGDPTNSYTKEESILEQKVDNQTLLHSLEYIKSDLLTKENEATDNKENEEISADDDSLLPEEYEFLPSNYNDYDSYDLLGGKLETDEIIAKIDNLIERVKGGEEMSPNDIVEAFKEDISDKKDIDIEDDDIGGGVE